VTALPGDYGDAGVKVAKSKSSGSPFSCNKKELYSSSVYDSSSHQTVAGRTAAVGTGTTK